MVLWSFLAMFFAPLIEEFFFRGVVLQKWVVKWGIKTGIIASSLFFALYHFRYDIIPLFISGLIYSILYFKNNNLISPIISHFFYNTLVAILNGIDFFLTPETERNTFMSVETYQNYIQSLLSQRIFLIAVSAPFVIYFIYKNFPKNHAIIPYYANSAKIHETS
ncbi:MAG: CPBP family intramembrane metalloprotease [Okeania sp. SIO2C2]|uniref:CPBP family intramembrane glutamic endopeptidase n=1 Tax=Okeania sp. SIO2C2 TaxID=2607787 RepID=UPI0013B63F12|nr:CPBP family intramembrane metalloprotease [Okeania sp. SIO2C2]NEP87323.1 CPBP family intramembrane metalloprotease [Okeania sp. SIO2C2]